MKPHRFFLAIVFLFSLLSCNAQTNTPTDMQQAEHALKKHPKDQQAWQQLYALMNDNYVKLTADERARLRKILQQYGIWSTGTLYTPNEPGTRIIIKGHVINTEGKPVANASLNIFQTDSHGYYTPLDSIEKKMGEPDARLFCFLKTDENGSFEIHTVRPASYPMQYDGRTIPQHIHNNITARGYTGKNLQMVFEDDPAMNSYWRLWAANNNFPVLQLNNDVPEKIATVTILLMK